MSVEISPAAENTEASRGTITRRTPSSAATQPACRPPAPPKDTSVNSRGSSPANTVRSRIASAITELATRNIPAAVANALSPSSPARTPITRSAAARVEPHPPAEEELGVEQAEHDVRVGHRRAARRRARRTPRRARRPRSAGPTRSEPPRADPADRAAAGADRRDVDHRRRQRLAVEELQRRGAHLAAVHEPDVGARPAHVEGDQMSPALAERLGAHHAGHRARSRPSAPRSATAPSMLPSPPSDFISSSVPP